MQNDPVSRFVTQFPGFVGQPPQPQLILNAAQPAQQSQAQVIMSASGQQVFVAGGQQAAGSAVSNQHCWGVDSKQPAVR